METRPVLSRGPAIFVTTLEDRERNAPMSIATGMKMYNSQLSPYAARCRIAIYAKDLDVELVEMPDPAAEEEFSRLAPMHKVPLLVDGDVVVPESGTICEYLEDRGLGLSLRPADPAAMALMRTLGRICDLYAMEPMNELFGQINPADRDQAVVTREMALLVKAMSWLDHYVEGPAYAVGGALSLADCMLAPTLFFFDRIGPMFGEAAPLRQFPAASDYYKAICGDAAVAKAMAELDISLRRMMGS